MHVADLAFSRALGLGVAPPGADHLLELPWSRLVLNHLGTVHAAAQFTLAESASAEFLQREYGRQLPAAAVLAVIRSAAVKYRHPARGDLLAYARLAAPTREQFAHDLATRTRLAPSVQVDLKDRAGVLTFSGRFDWFIQQPAPAPA